MAPMGKYQKKLNYGYTQDRVIIFDSRVGF